MADRVLGQEKVEPIWDTTLAGFVTDAAGKMSAVKLQNVKNGEESDLDVKGVFMAIGHTPTPVS